MATESIGRGPAENEMVESAGNAPKQGDFHQDVEVGMEMVDLDRIEQVYRLFFTF
jgi:hypothetical protein